MFTNKHNSHLLGIPDWKDTNMIHWQSNSKHYNAKPCLIVMAWHSFSEFGRIDSKPAQCLNAAVCSVQRCYDDHDSSTGEYYFQFFKISVGLPTSMWRHADEKGVENIYTANSSQM